MRNLIFIILFLLIACKKNESDPRIFTRQQPSKISVFSVDTGTGAQVLQYEIDYFYNDSLKRFDSISVDEKMYIFNYTKLSADNKILLNFTDSNSAFEELIFDVNFYFLKTYNKRSSSASIVSSNILQYDAANKLSNNSYNTLPANNNFNQNFLYKNDSIFLNTNKPFNSCEIHDTIVNTFVNMNESLPYLLFLNINNTCIQSEQNLLNALLISNTTNRFPFKILNETSETSFTYKGDSKSRLAEALIVSKDKSSNLILKKIKIVVTY